MAPRLKKLTKRSKKSTPEPVKKYLTPTRCVLTPVPSSNTILKQHVLSPLYDGDSESTSRLKQIKKREYHNRSAHKEFQDIDLTAGYHSAHMKQLEINEELMRALIDISIAGLPDDAKVEMTNKYKELI